MGRSGSTSKRKSSKKKTFKISSEARRKKRSRRNKSRKLVRSDDSLSSSSEDESTSSSLVSSSSSESDYKGRRERSRVKGSRRRSRRRSSSPESDDSLRVRKRKRSKRKDDSETKKKKKKKKNKNKKPRREANISLTSSGSLSCSTCQGGDGSSDEDVEESEVEFLHRQGKREKKKVNKVNKDSSKDRHGNRDRRHRSRSSSYSKLSHHDGNNSVEELAVENNPRRLRSVITVARHEEEKEECQANKDEINEEIVYEYDDYPSCRSNDSNDVGNKRELADPSYLSSEKRSRVENLMLEVDSMSAIKSSKASSPAKNGIDGPGSVDAKEEETKDSAVGSDTDDLESILRQKALENLSRFRGRLQSKEVSPGNEKTDSQRGGKMFPAANIELVENKLLKQDSSSSTAIVAPQLVVPRSRFTWKRDPSVASKTEQKITKNSEFDSETTKHLAPCLPSKVCISGGNEEKEQVTSGSAVNHESESSKSRALEPKLHTLPNPKSDLSLTSIAADTPNTVAGSNKISDDVGISDTALETPASVSAEEHSSKEQHETETKDSSQFEQKTMSVMRGGELVQVSYKVYIPKKAPALARRKLKR